MKLKQIFKNLYICGVENPMDIKDICIENELDNITKIPYMRNIFFDYLQECFIDGYYGEYNNADAYASEISTEVLSSLGDLANLLNINNIMNRLPFFVQKCISATDSTGLAGGGALKAILGKNWNSDWDIFCGDESLNTIVNILEKSNISLQHNRNNAYQAYEAIIDKAHSNEIVPIEYKIQFIPIDSFLSPLDIVDKFDIRICQFVITKNIPCIYGTHGAFDDIRTKTINLNMHTIKPHKLDHTIARIEKYKERGFTSSKDAEELVKHSTSKYKLALTLKRKKTKNTKAVCNNFQEFGSQPEILLAHQQPDIIPNYEPEPLDLGYAEDEYGNPM